MGNNNTYRLKTIDLGRLAHLVVSWEWSQDASRVVRNEGRIESRPVAHLPYVDMVTGVLYGPQSDEFDKEGEPLRPIIKTLPLCHEYFRQNHTYTYRYFIPENPEYAEDCYNVFRKIEDAHLSVLDLVVDIHVMNKHVGTLTSVDWVHDYKDEALDEWEKPLIEEAKGEVIKELKQVADLLRNPGNLLVEVENYLAELEASKEKVNE